MADEKLIQLTLQLPVSELTSVTALLEQLRQLLTEERPRASTAEVSAQSDSFDEARFQAMLLTSPEAAPVLSAQPESAVDRGSDELPAAAGELPISRADDAAAAAKATEAAFGELPMAASGFPTADSPLSEEPPPVANSALSPAPRAAARPTPPSRRALIYRRSRCRRAFPPFLSWQPLARPALPPRPPRPNIRRASRS